MESFSQFVNLSGTEIKRFIALVVVAVFLAPTAHSASKSPTPKPKASPTKKATPKWPPIGFKSNGEVFAKIPNSKELIATASSDKKFANALAQKVDGVPICEKFSCGAIQIASLNGCTWWEVNAKLIGPTSPEDATQMIFGTIRTLVRATAPKEIVTVLLTSQEPLELRHRVSGISANCHHDAPSEKIPSSTYSALNS